MFEWFWDLFKSTKGLYKRKYHFELPYTMSPSNVFYGVQLLQKRGLFHKLPADMQDKMIRARNLWHPLKITESDLNKVDEETWEYIANQLGLKWSK